MSADRELLGIVQEIENVEADIRDRNKAKSDIYKAAADKGYDKKAIRKVVAARRLDPEVRNEQDDVFDTYMQAVERAEKGLVRAHVENIEEFDPITGEFVEREKAIEEKGLAGALSAALGVEVEIVRTNSNPVANVEEGVTGAIAAASNDPASRTDEDSERQHSSTVGFADDCRTGGKEQSDASAAPVGDAAAEAHGIPATNSEIATAAHGEAEAPSVERVSLNDGSSADANAGGDDVDGSAVRADTSNTAGGTVSNPPAKPLRPHCLRPDNCGGYGSHECFSCKKAAKAHEHEEEAA